ncbi:MAG TPA: response regulator transcription factor [Gaiellaceae bacterium]|nr:response regulator transcription factor [Gaiellaceae bacterium]HWB21753.1 response regulator transcription factor [Gaiellaceae bacterium]
MSDQKRILLIDDSETERAIVASRLEQHGFVVSTAVDGSEGMRKLYDLKPDLIVLDVVMPGIDGWQVLQRIREVSDVPVIMLTGRDTELERVRGLRGGADDYIGKPFSASELVARVEAVLRRAQSDREIKDIYDDGEITIDFTAREVKVRGESVALTPLEFRLLTTLTEHAGQVLSRDQLLEHVWGDAFARGGDEVKLYVRYLRIKIERDPAKPELIETVRGFGYRYRAA